MPSCFSDPLAPAIPPTWAREYGDDSYGAFGGLEVKGVSQRLRWIPAGRFTMGSPEGEPGRDEDEQQHEVILSEGFWLANTPCTQALWVAVMGENPAEFKSPERPVERVSFEACQYFLERLNRLVPALEAKLPTEAQWEYACRAGTETATYAGPLEILGQRHGPVLDAIAWYGGNCGRDFEHSAGHPISHWHETQYARPMGGTHPVAQKRANAWGLYDMLGNVWEWCADWYGDYPSGVQTDPLGPETGDHRVFRGGAWDSLAAYVRAPCRLGFAPVYGDSHRGFRFACGAVG